MFTKLFLPTCVCLILIGCATPVKTSFPKPPEVLMQPPAQLILLDPANKVKEKK